MFELILFDLDGTLTDPKEGITNCVRYALESFGIIEEDEKTLLKFIGPPLYDSFRGLYGFSESDAISAVNKYRERFQKSVYLKIIFFPTPKKRFFVLKKQVKRSHLQLQNLMFTQKEF